MPKTSSTPSLKVFLPLKTDFFLATRDKKVQVIEIGLIPKSINFSFKCDGVTKLTNIRCASYSEVGLAKLEMSGIYPPKQGTMITDKFIIPGLGLPLRPLLHHCAKLSNSLSEKKHLLWYLNETKIHFCSDDGVVFHPTNKPPWNGNEYLFVDSALLRPAFWIHTSHQSDQMSGEIFFFVIF